MRDDHQVKRMEDFGAQSVESWQLCAAWLSECQAMVLLLGKSYGTLLPGEDISYTHAEYEHASMRDVPILVFPSSDHMTAISLTRIRKLSSNGRAARERLADFSEQVFAEQQVQTPPFRNSDELVGYVRSALGALSTTPPRARPRWRDRPRTRVAATVRAEIARAGFRVVLVDLNNVYQERTPAEPKRRVARKLREDVQPALASSGIPADLFTDLEVDAPTDGLRFAERLAAARATSVIVLVAEGRRPLGAAESFYGGNAVVGEWRRSWLPEPSDTTPVQATDRQRYTDADLHSCDLAGRIQRFVERHLEATLGATRKNLERSVLVASASIGGVSLVAQDVARVLRVSPHEAEMVLAAAGELGLLALHDERYMPTPRGRRVGRVARRFARKPSPVSQTERPVDSYMPRTWPPRGEDSTV